jgi:spermidine/putrescine-binding protein
MNKRLLGISTVTAALMATSLTVSAQEELHIYNWSDYIA